MNAKKNKATASSDSMPAVKIGSRVRCTDDGMMGKIAWANGVSVKIKWDDGEQVTWRRDELPGKPIEIHAADDESRNEQSAPEAQTATTEATPAPEQATPTEQPEQTATATSPTTSEQEIAAEAQATDAATITAEAQTTNAAAIAIPEQAPETPATEPIPTTTESTEAITPALGFFTPEPAEPAKAKRERKVKTPAEPKKVSALDAAARVLAEAGTALTCKEMIAAMAIKGYRSSPGGKTPDSTLCAAILTEIKKKGEQSRFIKTAPGRFASRPTV